jgi:plastocyanin
MSVVPRALLPLLAVPALALAGCGSEDASGGTAAADCAQPCVVMQDNEFAPRDLTVRAGQTVTWVNSDPVVHDVANVDEGAQPRSPLFGQDRTFTFTPSRPGRIAYVCTIHPGMEGTLTVR